GKDVVVRDVPACVAYSYTWQGTRNDAAIAKALAALDKALVADHVTAKRYRILSYNSPFISRSKQTHELQAILK
ncbi:MAG: heme-binding protein, partial [Verrucomicrobiota bacterium]